MEKNQTLKTYCSINAATQNKNNAGHGFANPTDTQAFRKDEALDAWNKTLDFLNRNLKS